MLVCEKDVASYVVVATVATVTFLLVVVAGVDVVSAVAVTALTMPAILMVTLVPAKAMAVTPATTWIVPTRLAATP